MKKNYAFKAILRSLVYDSDTIMTPYYGESWE